MGVYSVVLPDQRILKRVNTFKSIVILGCTACANNSIAYDTNLPLAKVVIDKKTGQRKQLPVAIVKEAKRLKILLQSKGKRVAIKTWPGLCVLSDETESENMKLVKRCRNPEAVIVLSCEGGVVGAKRRFGSKTRVISGMKTIGVTQRYTVTDDSSGFVYIDKNRSTIIRIWTEKPKTA